MKKIKALVVLMMTVFLLSGCLYPKDQLAENQVPAQDQLDTIQKAVDQFRKDSGGLLPIKTRDQNTDIFIKYLVDYEKLIPKYLTKAPANSYEQGGLYQYIIWDPEKTAQVKLVDLQGAEKIREINLRKVGTTYVVAKEQIAKGVFSIDYKKMGYTDPITVPSPYSGVQLPLIMTGDGGLYVDYSIDLYRVLKEKKVKVTPGEDIRHILYDNNPIVPAYSLPYTVNEKNEPVLMPKEK